MKRTITFLAIALMVLLTGCKKINEQFENINDRLDQIEGSSLTTIDQQIKNINASLADLKDIDAALQGLIDALEAADEDHSELIAALQAKDAELDQKIADLQAYVDGEVAAVEDWAEATFATLTQYEGVQAEIAAIKLLLEQYRNEITEEYTEAIVNAIAESEKSMKAWVNELLAEGYYDIAEIDAKLEALEAELADEDAELAKEIEDQQAALEQAKKDLTAAYEKAISDAIETNNGVINAAVAKAVQDAIDKVDTRLAVIDNTIAGIQKDIEAIKGSIASIEKQIAGINASIADLEKTDAALQALIDALEAADEDYSELIAALQAKDADLEKKISDLKAYIDGEIDATEDWAEATFATLAQYEAVQKEIAAIKALIEQNKTDLTAAYTKAIEDAIAQSETSMKAWVNELLAEGYYDIAEIDGKLAALEASLAGADAELAKDIEDQQAALEQAKKDLAAAYQKAIADAIKTNNGAIDRAIANAVNDAIAETDAKLTVIGIAISVIQKDIVSLKNSIATIEQQIRNINSSIASLKNADAALQALIDALEVADEDHSDLIAALLAKDAELEKKIAGLQAYVDGEITATEDWAEATFATLEQYEQLQTEFADIKALVDGFEVVDISVFLDALEEAIAASEESMKSWVNKLLAEGYYNIADIDGKLAALKTMIEKSDAALAEQLKEQKEALEQAKKDLTAAYQKAIEDAIDSNNGAIDEAIAQAVQEATEEVNEKLALIEEEITAIRKEIGLLNERINSIEEQIVGIYAAISELEAMDVVLEGLIDDLIDNLVSTPEGDSSAELMDLIEKLQMKDQSLEDKMAELQAYADELQSYVDGEIDATKNWAKATFATLAQYEAVQKEIAAIKALVDGFELVDISVFREALEEAIAASEESMKSWVNELLAEGYYDIAEIDGKLAALESMIEKSDAAALAEQLKEQKEALEQAKKDLTAAYEKAISEAIETNNGVINAAVAKAVQDAIDKVDTRLAVIDNTIAGIQKDIEAIKGSIASIEKQIAGINSSIASLKNADAALQALIDALEAADEDHSDLIEALQAKDEELEEKITELQAYVDGEITDTQDWAEATFATLAQYEAVQKEIAAIKALVDGFELVDISVFREALEEAIAASEESMKSWVNDLLAEGYYDIAKIDGKLLALETRLAGADAELKKQIEDQKAALEQARKDLTAAYEKAIADAIETNNGVITAAIAKAVETAQNALQAQIDDIYDEIEDINDRLTKLENNFANRIQSLTYIPKYSDGKIKLDYASSTTSATFRISPAFLAEFIRTENVQAFARYTDDPVTRAVNSEFSMTVTSVTTGNNGIFEVALAESNEKPFADNFWNGDVEAVVYIRITDNNGNDVVSEAIPMIAHNYVGNGNSIDGFGEGEDYTGTVTR